MKVSCWKGPPGLGKSTCLRALLPPARDEWFTDSLNLSADLKVQVEALQGRVIVEAAELTGITRADTEQMKAFLSRTDDGGVRRAYRRDPEPSPRRCVIVGTADREQPLPNDANLRRFVPISLDNAGNPTMATDVRAMVSAERELLWAEALAMYRDGVEGAAAGLAQERCRQRRPVERGLLIPIIEDAVSTWTSRPRRFPPWRNSLRVSEWRTRSKRQHGSAWPMRCGSARS